MQIAATNSKNFSRLLFFPSRGTFSTMRRHGWPVVSHGSWASGFWSVSCLSQVQLALPVKSANPTVSRQQAQWPPVILDQYTHLHTHLSTNLSHRMMGRRTHRGWLMTYLWMKRQLWMVWFRVARLRLTNLSEACACVYTNNNTW